MAVATYTTINHILIGVGPMRRVTAELEIIRDDPLRALTAIHRNVRPVMAIKRIRKMPSISTESEGRDCVFAFVYVISIDRHGENIKPVFNGLR